jgi:hypothetical protein
LLNYDRWGLNLNFKIAPRAIAVLNFYQQDDGDRTLTFPQSDRTFSLINRRMAITIKSIPID